MCQKYSELPQCAVFGHRENQLQSGSFRFSAFGVQALVLSTGAVGSHGYDVVGEIVHHGGLLFGGPMDGLLPVGREHSYAND